MDGSHERTGGSAVKTHGIPSHGDTFNLHTRSRNTKAQIRCRLILSFLCFFVAINLTSRGAFWEGSVDDCLQLVVAFRGDAAAVDEDGWGAVDSEFHPVFEVTLH